MSDQILQTSIQCGELWSDEVVQLVEEMIEDGLLEYVHDKDLP